MIKGWVLNMILILGTKVSVLIVQRLYKVYSATVQWGSVHSLSMQAAQDLPPSVTAGLPYDSDTYNNIHRDGYFR